MEKTHINEYPTYKKGEPKVKKIVATVGILYAILSIISKDQRPFGDLVVHQSGESSNTNVIVLAQETIYEKYLKRALDKMLSFGGLVILSPLYIIIALAIIADDPGPVFFSQKRIGKNKVFFMCHKFRSMKVSTPHDVPTHMLEDPGQYITRVGKFLRKYSLDELPQIWDIFIGKMSIIGPRPALWNQDDLVTERDKYGANDVVPGLTGWAQINGRDALKISEKAKFDGEYVEKLRQGTVSGFFMDVKCFLGTIKSVLKHDGVIEGRTGEMHNS